MNINRDFLSKNNINGTGNPCKYIVIHETDNTRAGANARAHAAAQHDGNFEDMSVHYYCGSDGIYQAAEHTCKCWHVGRTYVSHPNVPDCNNNNSIGIEICVNADGDYNTARNNAIALVKHLIQPTSIPVDRVIRHYDAKGKYCPRKMLDNPSLWEDFKSQIRESGSAPAEPAGDTYTVQSGDTLSKIAKTWGVSVADLARANGINNPDVINVDQVICKPAGPENTNKNNGGTAYMFKVGTIGVGDEGNDVLLAQEILKSRGYYKGNLDKSFGPQMDSATRAYQTDRQGGAGPVDGIIGSKCWADMIAL